MSQWRQRARLVVLALVVLSFAWGGVRLVDPMQKSPEMRTVDASDPPARIAYDAMMQTEEGNYAYVVWFGNGTSRERAGRVHIDTADRQFASFSPAASGTPKTAYGGEEGTWSQYSTIGQWVPTWQQWSGHRVFGSERAVLESGADVSLVARNGTAVVVRVNDTATAMRLGGENLSADAEPRASVTLVVDRDRGVLTRSVFRYSWVEETDDASSRRTSVVVREYRRWGAVDVRRPTGLPYGFTSVLKDVTNQCAGCEEDDE